MAPGLLESTYDQVDTPTKHFVFGLAKKQPIQYEPGKLEVEDDSNYEHDWALPHFPDVKWPPLEEVPYEDKGLSGHPKFENLLASATDVFDYTPKIGTEVTGVDLANLTNAQKNDLARLIAIRGVVFFRDQKNLDIDKQRELGMYFGHLRKYSRRGVFVCLINELQTNTLPPLCRRPQATRTSMLSTPRAPAKINARSSAPHSYGTRMYGLFSVLFRLRS